MSQKLAFRRIIKFVCVGFTATIIQLTLMWIMVEVLGWKGYYFKNLANIISGELGLIYAFALNRIWTWRDNAHIRNNSLLHQFILYHSGVLLGIVVKICLFATLDLFGIYYLINVLIGVGIAAAINYVFFDKIVFRDNIFEFGKSVQFFRNWRQNLGGTSTKNNV